MCIRDSLSPGKQRQAAVGKVTGVRWKPKKTVKRLRPTGSLLSPGTGGHGQDSWWEEDEDKFSWEAARRKIMPTVRTPGGVETPTLQVCLQFWLSAGAGTKCCYATAQLLLHESTLPSLTSPWGVPHANTFCTDLLNLAEAALYHV